MKSNYQAIFFDLDGTVVAEDYKISKGTVAALDRLRSAGLKVSVATGRSVKSAAPFVDLLQIDQTSIYSNGAVYHNRQTDEVEYLGLIPQQKSKLLADRLMAVDIPFRLQTSQQVVYSYKSEEWPPEISREGCSQLNAKALEQQALKFIILWDKHIDELLSQIASAELSQIKFFRSSDTLIEVSLSWISKGHAMKGLLDKWDIPITKAIAVGDQQNDFEMIRDAGFGVSVEEGFDDNHLVSKLRIAPPSKDGIIFLVDYIMDNLL